MRVAMDAERAWRELPAELRARPLLLLKIWEHKYLRLVEQQPDNQDAKTGLHAYQIAARVLRAAAKPTALDRINARSKVRLKRCKQLRKELGLDAAARKGKGACR